MKREHKVLKNFRLSKKTLRTLLKQADITGKTQTKLVEEAIAKTYALMKAA